MSLALIFPPLCLTFLFFSSWLFIFEIDTVQVQWPKNQLLIHLARMIHSVFIFNFLFYIGVEWINDVVLVSGIQQSDLLLHIHVSSFSNSFSDS